LELQRREYESLITVSVFRNYKKEKWDLKEITHTKNHNNMEENNENQIEK